MSVHEKVSQSVDKAKIRIKSLIKIVSDLGTDDVKEAMTETNLLLKDSRYEIMQTFLSNYRSGLVNELKSLSNVSDVSIVDIVRIGAKITVLTDLIERPNNIVEEYKRLDIEEKDDTESMVT